MKHISPQGILGYKWKITWDAGTPAWFTLANRVLGFAIIGGPTAAGYPITSKTTTQPAKKTAAAMRRTVHGELGQLMFPSVPATVTVDLFGPVGAGVVKTGDDILLNLGADERFIFGLYAFFRVVQADYSIADEGQSTATYVLDQPPNTGLSAGGWPSYPAPVI